MKKSILLIALAMGISTSYAQLTTRENESSVEKVGARPQAGDMSFTFGLPLSKVTDDEVVRSNSSTGTAHLFNLNNFKTGELLTFKYYKSDDVAYRLGFRIYSDNVKTSGTGLDSADVVNAGGAFNENYNVSTAKNADIDRKIELVPGIEKHFSPANFFDAYVGGDLYLGLGTEKTVSEVEFKSGDHSNMTSSTPNSTVGLGGVAGFNIFIAHLPISIGLEWGWNAKWEFSGKTKVKYDRQVGTVSASGEYVTLDGDPNGSQYYSKASSKFFNADTNSDVRIVANIYFGK